MSICLIIFDGKQFEKGWQIKKLAKKRTLLCPNELLSKKQVEIILSDKQAKMKKLKNIFKIKKMSAKQNESVNEKNSENEEQIDFQPVDEKNNQTDELQAKIAELNDKYMRLYSDFDNFRKRTAKEKMELIQAGGEDVFKSMLPVIDDFERAIKSNAEITDIDTINEGVNLIYNKFKNVLAQKGLEEMKSIGEPFNTDLHEAITNIPAPSEDMKGKVIEELEKGYILNSKVIRFAKVVIGN